MNKLMASFLFLLFINHPLWAYKLTYKEQVYELYHRHLYAYPNRTWENLMYLEEALDADFANPLNALTRIETKEEWNKYQKLFDMHIHLKIVENYLILGNKFDKQKAYFYNAPYKDITLRSLDIAEKIYNFALPHWVEAVKLAKETENYPYLFLEGIQFWEDEAYRINHDELNYESIINKQINRLIRVREELNKMDSSTFPGPGENGIADPDKVGELNNLFKDWEGFIK